PAAEPSPRPTTAWARAGAPSLQGQPHTPEEAGIPRVGAEAIQPRVDREEHALGVARVERLAEPDQGAVVLAEPGVDDGHVVRRDRRASGQPGQLPEPRGDFRAPAQ